VPQAVVESGGFTGLLVREARGLAGSRGCLR